MASSPGGVPRQRPADPPDRLDAAEVVRRLGGTAPIADILRYSTQYSVRRATAIGTLHRISHGIYALPEAPSARRAAVSARGLVSHQSAAAYWLMDGIAPAPGVHVTVSRNARPPTRKGVVLHYSDIPASQDAGGVTSPLRTVLDCAATLPFAEALAIADSALRRELLTGEQLVEAARRLRGAGRQRIWRVAVHADGLAANPFESGLRAIVIDTGVSGFEPQVTVRSGQLSMRVDLGDRVRRIALEADSFTYHGSRDALERDCRRYNELVRSGWIVLRFAWEHVMFHQAWASALIMETCALRDAERRQTRQK